MEQSDLFNESIERRTAQRIRSLRTERQWPLDELANKFDMIFSRHWERVA